MASTLQITVTNLNGDVVFGPEAVERTLTVTDLKRKFVPDKKKKLATQDGNFLANDGTFEGLPAEVCLSMVFDREPTVEQASGSWFGSHYIPDVDDAELERKVFYVDGVCWFYVHAKATLEDGGTYSVSFRLKRTNALFFGVPIILTLNGVEQRRVEFEEELQTNDVWCLLHVGDFEASASGVVEAEMKGADCADAGQGSKRGLFIDQLVCTPV
eukprot:gnl/TRDRNA2_/TRDRNA2_127245_c0_seq1.p1 gnl/TRDRNA2_/TRDRNA2_127245_c0~~gnl/TRDRNA2_/TRDRNA2_127245_c0_seq1.p1  ORF type:complete len:214 (+),score=48.07 gnl/TRDRNA2_/TRDRNA2_127245_c0_seq1:74-715(+)